MLTAPILIVEDNPDSLKLVTWLLEDAGYPAEGVGTAEEGLAALAARPFALVLMDIGLPRMDGKEATRRIRTDARFADLPVIALTAHAIMDETAAILASGVTMLLTKPLDEDELLAAIRSFLPAGEGARAHA